MKTKIIFNLHAKSPKCKIMFYENEDFILDY